jgi:hypothetical protein
MKEHSKKSRLDPASYMGDEAEMKLAEHVQKLQAADFAPTRKPKSSGKNKSPTFL